LKAVNDLVSMLKNILIATDGSTHSEEAAKVGVELARLYEGRVTILHVIETGGYIPMPFEGFTPRPYAKDEASALSHILMKNGEEAIKRIEDLVRDSGVAYEKIIVEGHPASEILNIAEESEPKKDIIVIGSIGKTGLEKFLIGSVAEKVARNSKVPVLIVPPGRPSKISITRGAISVL
jgi:nucleotide-binding universal stress UspA family protein